MTELLNLSTTVSAQSDAFVRGIENCRGGLRNLIASLDPAAQATDRFNRNMGTLDRALKQGKISADDYGVYVARLRDRLNQVAGDQGRVNASTGQLRSGMQQLSYQMGDVAQGFAMGTPPMTIFIQQSGQIIQAVQLMTNSTKGFIGFLAGPWGAALTGAATIVGSIALNHLKAADATDEHKKAADDLKRAQDRLAEASAKANKETRQGILDSIDAANAKRMEARETLRAALAKLRDASSALETARQSNDEGAVASLGTLSLMMNSYRGQIAQAEADMKTWAGNVALDRAKLAMRDLAGETDKTVKANQDYEDSLDRIKRKFEEGGFGNPADDPRAVAELKRQAAAAIQVRDNALQAVKDAEKAASEAERKGKRASTAAVQEAKNQAKEADKAAKDLLKMANKASEQLQQRSDAALAAAFPDQNAISSLMGQMRDLDAALASMLIDPVTWAQARARFADQIEALRTEMTEKSRGIFEVQGMVIDTTKMVDMKNLSDQSAKALEGVSKRFQEQQKSAEDAGRAVVNMANDSLNALSNLANSIKGGGVLGILSGLFNAFGSLSSTGLFGESLGKAFKDFVPITGFRERGGPVSAGKAYVVGEKRPEVFVPDRSGYILPSVGNDNNPGRVRVEVVPSPYFNAVVDGRAQAAAAPIGMRAAAAGSSDAQRAIHTSQKNRIPGR